MSEGTMQRRAQRADRSEQRAQRVTRRRRALVGAAALPVVLLAAACSSGSDSDGGDAKPSSPSVTASPSPTVREAAYGTLPEACDVLSDGTLEDLVPEARKAGKEGSSDDLESRASCSWDSLDNNGVKGSQFRWLNVSLLRFESDVARGAGDELAKEYYDGQVEDARAVTGARNVKSAPAAGIGDEATAVRYDLKKKEGSFKQQTVVVRAENVVVTVDYNGAGLAGDRTPDADELMKDAQKAAEEAVAAVLKANSAISGDSDAKVPSATKSASKSPSKTASTSPSKSASASSGTALKQPSATKSSSTSRSSSKTSTRKS
jgi:DNA-binding protein YbaB